MQRFNILTLVLTLLLTVSASAQSKRAGSYIGYVYPAGAPQGQTIQLRLGGQKLTGVYGVHVSGEGVQARFIETRGRMNPQDTKLLRDQLKILRKNSATLSEEDAQIAEKIEARAQAVMDDYVRKPASDSLASLVLAEITVDADAKPGAREIRIMTSAGLSNPLPFYIGQLPEYTRKPMKTSSVQTLGKEALALRKRPADEQECAITLPCTLNGQIASGEVNRYCFELKQGQKLVVSTLARQLVPYIADAVPGWFQPILSLHDASGNEVAYNDDYFFKPDPVILYEAEKDDAYVLTIHDSIYRGREDFVYRIRIGETPFITGFFPLGGRAGKPASTKINGWNLNRSKISFPSKESHEGVHLITAKRRDILSNHVPFKIDTLPETTEKTGNDSPATAQTVRYPVIINGRCEQPGDTDVFRFIGKAGTTLVAEVHARRLDSPLDSIIKLTNDAGEILAVNDDHGDPGSGINTHHADSYIRVQIPVNGIYYLHIGDTARHGGDAYAYRLRLSHPRPDFELRTVPSRINMRGRMGGSVQVYAIRKDGFKGPISISLDRDYKEFTARTVVIPAGEEQVKFVMKSRLLKTEQPIAIQIEGQARIGGETLVRTAVPSEDWMQAFLWRHLVPGQELLVNVFNTEMLPIVDRERPPLSPEMTKYANLKWSKEMAQANRTIKSRIQQMNRLFDAWLVTDDFYVEKIEELKEFTN